MKRRPTPALITTALPALAALLSQCTREPTQVAVNAPPPPPPPPPPAAADAGAADLTPMRLDPSNIPPVPLAGAPMMVTPLPHPPPAPMPAPSAPAPMRAPAQSAPAPMAAAAPMAHDAPMAAPATPTEPGLYIVHNHPPGTACRPISQTELQQAASVGTSR